MELIVEQGRGYMPVEAREGRKQEIGMIAVDAIFTPIKSVHFDVSNVRVGQLTNFDKLELVIETDGSIDGQEAVDIASHILVDHFTMIYGTSESKIESGAQAEEVVINAEIPSDDVVQTEGENEIQASTLSTRSKNALVKNNITTMEALKALTSQQIENLSGLGDKSIQEILEFLGRN
jgi:DNA-directed RNA polymerase subunit alpha